MHAVEFDNVSRLYGDVRAVDGVSIAIRDGEFFSMLGPSGSGKTTCLRLIAGFEQLSGGAIRIFGKAASELPPWQRDVNTVFQAACPRAGGAGEGRARVCPRAQAIAAFRRPAPAGGDRPRAGESAARPAAR